MGRIQFKLVVSGLCVASILMTLPLRTESQQSRRPQASQAIRKLATTREFPKNLKPPQAMMLNSVVSSFRAGDVTTGMKLWNNLVAEAFQGVSTRVQADGVAQTLDASAYFAVGEYARSNPQFSPLLAAAEKLDYCDRAAQALEVQKREFQTATSRITTARPTISVSVVEIPPFVANRPIVFRTFSKTLGANELSQQIKAVEQLQEEIRNKRDEAQTTFENFDEKAKELFGILSAILKQTNENASAVVRKLG